MSKVNGNITPERRELLNKADSYLEEWEEAALDLEESAEKFGRNLLIIASIGIGLAFSYKLLSSDDEEGQNQQNIKTSTNKKSWRFSSAMKAITVPFLVGIAKNVVFPDLNKSKKDNNGGNP